MPRWAVVFDTNTYRSLGAAAIPELRALERSRGVMAFGHFVAAQELLTHIADSSDPEYAVCRSALRALWAHCSYYNGFSYYLAPLPMSDAHMAVNLFDRELPGVNELRRLYGSLVQRIGTAKPADSLEGVQRTLTALAVRAKRVRDAFVDHFEKHAVRPFAAHGTAWAPIVKDPALRQRAGEFYDSGAGVTELAIGRVRMLADKLAIALDDNEVSDRAARVEAFWRTPLEYFNGLVRSIVLENFNLAKGSRANAFWDYEIAFSISRHINLCGLPILFVTDDQRLHRAAGVAGDGERVFTLARYQDVLSDNTFSDLPGVC